MPFDKDGNEILWYSPNEYIAAYSMSELISDLKDISKNTVREFFPCLLTAILNCDRKSISKMNVEKKYRQYQIPKEIYEYVKILISKKVNNLYRINDYIKYGVPADIFKSFPIPFCNTDTELQREMILTYIAVCYIKRNFEPNFMDKFTEKAVAQIERKYKDDIEQIKRRHKGNFELYYNMYPNNSLSICEDLSFIQNMIENYKEEIVPKIQKYARCADKAISDMPQYVDTENDIQHLQSSVTNLKTFINFIKNITTSFETSLKLIDEINTVGQDYNSYKDMSKN